MGNKRVIVSVVATVVILASVGAGIFLMNNKVNSPDRLLNLGEKYLSELNYEQALVQFLKIIEIDPMNPRGYTGAAEAYVGLGRTEEAIAILQQGFERTGDDGIRDMLERIEQLDDSNDANQQDVSLPTTQDMQNPDGANYGFGQGNTLSNYLSGGKAIKHNGYEYFVISGKLYTKTENGIECVLDDYNDYENGIWCRLDGWLGISGNWLYAYSAVNDGGVVRYNMLTEEWNVICNFSDYLSYTYNPSVLVINDRIIVIEADGSNFWSMDLLGGNMHKIASFPSSHIEFLFLHNGRLFYSASLDVDVEPSAPEIIGADLYREAFTWGQIYSMDIKGQDIQQASSKNVELRTALSAWPSLVGRNAGRPQDIDESPSPPIGYEFVMPLENALYCFDGSVIWKVENGITEAVWQHIDHTTYGNLDYIWSYSGDDSWPNIYRQRVVRPLWVDYPYMVLAEYDMEWTGDGNGSFSCTDATLLQTYIFNVVNGAMQQDNPYGSVLTDWAALPHGYGLVGSDVWYRFFTEEAIYELEQDSGEFYELSNWYLYDRKTGVKSLLGTVSEIEQMPKNSALKP